MEIKKKKKFRKTSPEQTSRQKNFSLTIRRQRRRRRRLLEDCQWQQT